MPEKKKKPKFKVVSEAEFQKLRDKEQPEKKKKPKFKVVSEAEFQKLRDKEQPEKKKLRGKTQSEKFFAMLKKIRQDRERRLAETQGDEESKADVQAVVAPIEEEKYIPSGARSTPARKFGKAKTFGSKKVVQPGRYIPKSLVLDGTAYPVLKKTQNNKNVGFTKAGKDVKSLREALKSVPGSQRLTKWKEYYSDLFKVQDLVSKDGENILDYIFELGNSDIAANIISSMTGDGILSKPPKEAEVIDIDLDLTGTARGVGKKPEIKIKKKEVTDLQRITQPKDLKEFFEFMKQEGMIENTVEELIKRAIAKGYKIEQDLVTNPSAMFLATTAFNMLYGSMGLAPIRIPTMAVITGLSLLIGDTGLKNESLALLEDNKASKGDRLVLDDEALGNKMLEDVLKFKDAEERITFGREPNTLRGEPSKTQQIADSFNNIFSDYDNNRRNEAMYMLTNLSSAPQLGNIQAGNLDVLTEFPRVSDIDPIPPPPQPQPQQPPGGQAPQPQGQQQAPGGQAAQPPGQAPQPQGQQQAQPQAPVQPPEEVEINPKEEIMARGETLPFGMDVKRTDDKMDVGIHNFSIQRIATANDIDFTFRKSMIMQFNPKIENPKNIIEKIILEYGFLLFIEESLDNFSIEEAYELMTLKDILLENIRVDKQVKQSLIKIKDNIITASGDGDPENPFSGNDIGFILNGQSLGISPQQLVQNLQNINQPQAGPVPPQAQPVPPQAPPQQPVETYQSLNPKLKKKGRLNLKKKKQKKRVGIKPAQNLIFRSRLVNPVNYQNLRNNAENIEHTGNDLIFRNNKKDIKNNKLVIFR